MSKKYILKQITFKTYIFVNDNWKKSQRSTFACLGLTNQNFKYTQNYTAQFFFYSNQGTIYVLFIIKCNVVLNVNYNHTF